MSGTGRVRAQRADTWLKLWHPDSPGVRVFIAPSRWRRWGIVRSKFATLGEVKRMYEAMEDPVTDSPCKREGRDDSHRYHVPERDQCPVCRAAPGMPHSRYCGLLPSRTEDSSGGQRTCIDDDFPAARSAIGAGPVFGHLQSGSDFESRFACRPIPLHEQALWLARHIESVTSPRPDVVSDDELRGTMMIRALSVGAQDYGDAVFRKGAKQLRQEKVEELADFAFYDTADRFGGELR